MSRPMADLSTLSVATPPSGLCPVCLIVPLHGKQAVCSPRCRIQKSMERRAAKQAGRDATIRLLLTTALEATDLDRVRQQIVGVLRRLDYDHEP